MSLNYPKKNISIFDYRLRFAIFEIIYMESFMQTSKKRFLHFSKTIYSNFVPPRSFNQPSVSSGNEMMFLRFSINMAYLWYRIHFFSFGNKSCLIIFGDLSSGSCFWYRIKCVYVCIIFMCMWCYLWINTTAIISFCNFFFLIFDNFLKEDLQLEYICYNIVVWEYNCGKYVLLLWWK